MSEDLGILLQFLTDFFLQVKEIFLKFWLNEIILAEDRLF